MVGALLRQAETVVVVVVEDRQVWVDPAQQIKDMMVAMVALADPVTTPVVAAAVLVVLAIIVVAIMEDQVVMVCRFLLQELT